MIDWLHNVFNRLSLREKLMLTALLWAGIFVWLGSVRRHQQEYKSASSALKHQTAEQSGWFTQGPLIDAQIKKITDRMQAQPFFDGSELAGKVDGFVRELGMSADISAPRSQQGDIFNVHSLTLRVARANLPELMALDEKLRGHSPYLVLERVTLRPDNKDPLYLSAQLTIQSLELKQSF